MGHKENLNIGMKRNLSYQFGYSDIDPRMHSQNDRQQKANKIAAILADYARRHKKVLKSMDALEIGCSIGGMTAQFAGIFKRVLAIDIDRKAIAQAKRTLKNDHITFLCEDVLTTRLQSGSFDIVICNHVYEHVPDATLLMAQIYRLLRKGGICYFAGPQKYTLIEPHYQFPFLSWIPKKYASFLLKMTGRGTLYYETPFSVRQLRRLVKKFTVMDYTIDVLQRPDRFSASHRLQSLLACVPRIVYMTIYPMLPSFFWVLKKSK
jgi:2-polyprenyl-3-methyl-5-hydroxy-6-metoxy-1,4-benzoquinol methylase